MMGEPLGRQDLLFYEFDLEDMVPRDHLLRRIDAVLDLSWLRGGMKAHYSLPLPQITSGPCTVTISPASRARRPARLARARSAGL
jgi:hypothetical protein